MTPRTHRLRNFFLWLLASVTGAGLPAQELAALGGATADGRSGRSSYSWQLDYRQNIRKNFAASIGYLNEGHFPGHHRDGNLGELWLRWPLGHDHFSVSLGAGGYYFYDTQALANGGSVDVHGTAPIYSFAATGYFADRWFYRFMFNRINPTRDIQLNTAAVGAGFWFGRDHQPTPGKLGDAPAERTYVTDSELTVFGGQSVVNTLFSQSARAYAVEYRRGLDRHVDWTATYVYEGDPEIVRRSGLAAQAWLVNTFFDERITVGIGVGPYAYIDKKHPRPGNQPIPAALAPLVGLTFSTRLSDHWRFRLLWDRVTTSYNRDADILLAGLGYRWSR